MLLLLQLNITRQKTFPNLNEQRVVAWAVWLWNLFYSENGFIRTNLPAERHNLSKHNSTIDFGRVWRQDARM